MDITIEKRGTAVIVFLDREGELTSLPREMLEALRETFEQIKLQPDVRAVILTGHSNTAFSGGSDINALTSLGDADAFEASKQSQEVCKLIERSPVPVIAAVNGIVAGVECELALACHLRVASKDSEFNLLEARIGAIPGYGSTRRLARIIGSRHLSEVMLSGRIIHAAEALHIGLVNRIAETSHLLEVAESLASEIAQLAPLAIRACLEAVTRGVSLPLEDGLALEGELFSRLFATEDVREGTSAFLEKRAPVFKGV